MCMQCQLLLNVVPNAWCHFTLLSRPWTMRPQDPSHVRGSCLEKEEKLSLFFVHTCISSPSCTFNATLIVPRCCLPCVFQLFCRHLSPEDSYPHIPILSMYFMDLWQILTFSLGDVCVRTPKKEVRRFADGFGARTGAWSNHGEYLEAG